MWHRFQAIDGVLAASAGLNIFDAHSFFSGCIFRPRTFQTGIDLTNIVYEERALALESVRICHVGV